jgi:hypothetical protein
MEEMDRMRIVAWSQTLRRWCLCNGFAKVLATAATKEEAEALAHQLLQAYQLDLDLP